MKSAGSIRQLDPSVVNRIAAGEAISCPSNAIKELIENSIDANSTRIIIEIDRGGYDLIRIIDDGCGINYEDLPIACKAHTTSKISEYSDLQNINTFGFRGEALHSISMVTHLKITTMTEKDELASVAKYEEGELIGQVGFTAATKGTIIEARDLFYNYHIRLQGINPNSEAKKITDIISKYSVIYPQISFTVRCNKKETLATFGKLSTSESVLRLLYGFDDINFFRCNFSLDEGVYVNLFLSEPNTKVTKKTNALFVNGRLIKNDALTKGIEESYTRNSTFGSCGTVRFSFITMSMPPQNLDVNIHPKKEKVKFLNEKEIISQICDKVKEIVNDHTKKTYSNSKTSSIYDAFYKSSKPSQKAATKNQTILQSFGASKQTSTNEASNNNNSSCNSASTNSGADSFDVSQNAIVSQADTNSLSFSTKNFELMNSNVENAGGFDGPTFFSDVGSNISHALNSSRVPTLASVSDFSVLEKVEEIRGVGKGGDEFVTGAEMGDDGEDETVMVQSLPTVSSSAMSTSPVRSSLFAAFNSSVREPLSQMPTKKSQTVVKKSSEGEGKIAFSQKPNSKTFLFLSEDEIDDFEEDESLMKSNSNRSDDQRKTQPTLIIVKDKDKSVADPIKKASNHSPPRENQPTLNISISTSSPPPPPQSTQPPHVSSSFSPPKPSSQSPNFEASPPQSSHPATFSPPKPNPSLLSSHAPKKPPPGDQKAGDDKAAGSIEDVPSKAEFISSGSLQDEKESGVETAKQPKGRISLRDLIDEDDNAKLISDLPSFTPSIQQKAIESIEKKNSRKSAAESSSPKPRAKKSVKGLRSVFDDLKYDPTNGAPSLNPAAPSQPLSQSRSRSRQTVSNDDSSMLKLEDLFQNVGDNMKRKFRVVKLLSIINMRKKREETADQELKRIFHSNKMKLVGFIGTQSVIFTAPIETETNTATIKNEEEEEKNEMDENRMIYVFNLFALMKDLLKHKFLELFSNLPTFNVELEIEEITNPSNASTKQKRNKNSSPSSKSIQERFDEVLNGNDSKSDHFFTSEVMKQAAMDCLDEKKDMLLDYFSIFYKNGMIKAMPDVIRGYRPSFSSFPLFLEKLVTDVDWEDETNCFECLIDQLAMLYSILPEDGNAENQKAASNLLLQFKSAVLPELADEGYSPNCSLREEGSFVAIQMPLNHVI